MSKQNASFEQALEELENIVVEMERGDISLEQSLQKFERGISLVRASQQQLANAEQKVSVLLSTNTEDKLESFSPEPDVE